MKRRATLRATAGYFVGLLAPERGLYAQLLLCQVALAVMAMTLPLVSGCVIGALSREGRRNADAFCGLVAPRITGWRLAGIAGVLVAIYLVRVALTLRRTYLENQLFRGIEVALQQRLFAHLQRLSHAFYAESKVGDLATRLMTDVRSISGSMGQIFGVSASLGLTALAAAVTALVKSPPVGVLILLVVPVLLGCNRVLGSRMAQAGHECATLTGEAASVVHESLAAHSVVKAFGLERRHSADFARRLSAMLRANIHIALTRQVFQATALLTITLAEVLVVAVGAYLVLRGTIADPGTLVTLLALLPLMLEPLPTLASATEAAQEVVGSIERVNEILDHPVDIEDTPGASPLPALVREIRLDGVSFGYAAERRVLHDLHLVIPVGSYVAIVGPSGSGKTTLVNLLMRFWDPDQGRVLIDGHDLRDVTVASLRSQIGLVSQDTFVFDTTLWDNIAMGRTGANDADIHAAASAARFDTVAELLGYETVIGERGTRLSGGQRQRLAIARALLRDPRILLLDEATSALDAGTEAAILDTLRCGGRITIAVTHRLAVAAAADTVLVLDGGRLVEQGPHDQLVSAGGLYQHLWERRARQEAAGEEIGSSVDVSPLPDHRPRMIPLSGPTSRS
jgi:ATP-binding cassette, subfamily B, bacterial